MSLRNLLGRTARFAFFLGLLASTSVAQLPDVLYLRFEEGAGTTTADQAIPGTGVVGTLTGGCTFSPNLSPLGNGAMQTGPSASDGVILQNPTVPATSTFTIEFWLELPTTGIVFPFGQTCATLSSNLAMQVSYSSGAVTMTIWTPLANGAFTAFTFTVPVTPFVGNWVHFALVWDQSVPQLLVYLNGTLAVTQPLTGGNTLQALFAPNFNIGGALANPCFVPAGQAQTGMDEFRIWGYARTAGDIFANFNVDLFLIDKTVFTSTPSIPITFNPANGTFFASGPVTELGSAFAIAPVDAFSLPNGATLTAQGNYSGTDYVNFSDFIFTPATISLTAVPGQDELVIQGLQTGIGAPLGYTTFIGNTAIIARRRPMISVSNMVVTRIGSGSPALDSMANAMASAATFSMILDSGLTGPRLHGIAADFALPPVTKESRLTTDGSGIVLLGDIGMASGAQLLHIFNPAPTGSVGTGPLLGLALNPTTWLQLQLPLPTTPFRVLADQNGDYAYLTTPGALPPGFVVDFLAVELPPGSSTIGYVSPVRRVTF